MQTTNAPLSNSDSLLKGSFETWGFWERMVPAMIEDDQTAHEIYDLLLEHYRVAAAQVQGKQVLDIACGVGYGSKTLKEAGAASVMGVDCSESALQHARTNYQLPGVEFLCADAEKFQTTQKFDVVVCLETIEHLHAPIDFLKNVHSYLNSDGYLFLGVPLGETRHIDAYHFQKFSQKDVMRLLDQAGFTIETHQCDVLFLSIKTMLEWRKKFPDEASSWSDLFLTKRGLLLLRALLFDRGIRIPQLLVTARPKAS
jgi:2-polyprenyl-3-methyl-5-hydroxy-6-metoxy-1,4-benzoquinol methylase